MFDDGLEFLPVFLFLVEACESSGHIQRHFLAAVALELGWLSAEADDALQLFTLGEDYLLLSAAEYDESNETIKNIDKRRGVDLIAPIAFTVPIKRSLEWAKVKGSSISKTATAVEVIRKLTTGWLKWLPIVGYYFGLLDQVAKDQSVNLTEKKEEAIKKGCFIDAVLIAFEQKLSAYGIEQTYLHR